MIKIETYPELIRWMELGYHPLYDWKRFEIKKDIRNEAQNLLFAGTEFSRGCIVRSNQKYYEHCWKIHEEKQCEECFRPLPIYRADYISHILPRGAYPEYALDVRNHNLLCKKCHAVWESSKNIDMAIYPTNKNIIEIIKK